MTQTQKKTDPNSSVVVSVRIDQGVLEEIDRLLAFRFRAPLGRESYLRMILYGDEPPVSPTVIKDNLVRLDFRLPMASAEELSQKAVEGNRSKHVRRILTGLEDVLSPPPSPD